MKEEFARIHIVGSVGSGKSTLGKRLSCILEVPCYSLDDLCWERNANGDRRRTEEERHTLLQSIVYKEN
ncbi:hypothetical protein [Bacillus coahuilensis]|uniref:hypothetical protein n=1 Tax=Bacillus coahuilensis TaxID=408580 RepID=UPI0001850CE0|nr:hypothetical protein [Bacillus coahuilensis]